MEVKIKTGGAVVMSEELSAFIAHKTEKIAVFLKQDSSALCEIDVGTTSAGQRTGDVYRAEFHVTFAGGDAYAEATEATLHKAIDRAAGEVRREIRKRKGKERDLVRQGAAEVKRFFRTFGK